MVPGNCLVSMFVFCARYVEWSFKERLSRRAINGVYKVLAERSNRLEEFLYEGWRNDAIKQEGIEMM